MAELKHLKLVVASALILGSLSAASAGVRITGALSNFDCWNDEGGDCDGFEIEIEDCRTDNIYHTYGGSAYGSPTVTQVGNALHPIARIRYQSSVTVVPQGGMTHFGVSLRSPIPAANIHYLWHRKPTFSNPNPNWHPVVLPTHSPELVTLPDGSQAVRDVIFNPNPNEGTIYWVLPFITARPGSIELEELMRDNPFILDSIPLGSGPDNMFPEQLDPQNRWFIDDAAESEFEVSGVLWYQVFANDRSTGSDQPGQMIAIVMDGTITEPDGSKVISGAVTLNDYLWPLNGTPITMEVRNSGSTTAVETHDVILNPDGTYSFNTLLTGQFDVAAKYSHWLRKKLPLNLTGGNLGGVNFALINGDIDEDNEIGIGDYAQLSMSYNAWPGDNNWIDAADLDGDGYIDIADFAILSAHYGALGDD